VIATILDGRLVIFHRRRRGVGGTPVATSLDLLVVFRRWRRGLVDTPVAMILDSRDIRVRSIELENNE
jgi:hypothetical protein